MRDRLDAALAGRYHVERELGRGGMATVWLATDVRSERPVAIKVLQPTVAGAIGVDRFAREVRLTAELHHPGIVPVLDTGAIAARDGDPPLPWYAMPFVEGESLRTRLQREHQLPIDEALRITTAVADALSVAHAHGIVHRDIKPENILLADGQVHVVDFGIAKALVEIGGDRLTSTGIAIGTPAYMSPEQASAESVDARSDQYSLATVAYEMLVGETPYTGPTAQAIIARRFAEPARPIRTVRSAVPEGMERAILKALERAPVDRHPDVATFARELRRTSGVVGQPARRRSRVAGVVILAGVALVAAAVAWQRREGAPPGVRTRLESDSVAVALYRRGQRGYDSRRPAGILDAIDAFGAAVRRDSNYAQAWSGLAKAYIRSYERAFVIPGVPSDSVLRLAVAASERALAIERNDADAQLTQAIVTRHIDPTTRTLSIRAARRAVALDSTDAPAWHFLAIGLMESGDFDGALRAWRRCVSVDPTYTQGLTFLALAHMWRRSYDSAAAWADSAIALDNNYFFGWMSLGETEVEAGHWGRASAAYAAATRIGTDVEHANAIAGSALVEARAGRTVRARALLGQADSLGSIYAPVPLHTAVYIAHAYAALGDVGSAMAWLERFDNPGDLHFQLHLRCDPSFDPIAGGRRFRALLLEERPPASKGCR